MNLTYQSLYVLSPMQQVSIITQQSPSLSKTTKIRTHTYSHSISDSHEFTNVQNTTALDKTSPLKGTVRVVKYNVKTTSVAVQTTHTFKHYKYK